MGQVAQVHRARELNHRAAAGAETALPSVFVDWRDKWPEADRIGMKMHVYVRFGKTLVDEALPPQESRSSRN